MLPRHGRRFLAESPLVVPTFPDPGAHPCPPASWPPPCSATVFRAHFHGEAVAVKVMHVGHGAEAQQAFMSVSEGGGDRLAASQPCRGMHSWATSFTPPPNGQMALTASPVVDLPPRRRLPACSSCGTTTSSASGASAWMGPMRC